MRPARGPAPDAPRRAQVTLRDVARAAGTTPMTVSNVVNGREGQVGAELRARVLAACEALGYRPNAGARLLRTNRHMAVGVVMVDPSPHYLSDPFTAALLAGMTDVFRSRGYAILLEGADAAALDSAAVMRRVATDGLCLVLSGPEAERRALLARVAALGQPLVLVQEDLPEDATDACAVLQDDRGGAAMIARHLFAEPTRQAVMLVPALAWPAMERRAQGVRDVLASLPVPPAFHLVAADGEGFEATQAALAAHVGRHGLPDAVIGGNDRMAIAALKWLVARGLSVPHDVRVTGFNAFDIWRYATPELTTVRSPAFELGEEAARAMIARIETGAFPVRRMLLPVDFMPHRSSVRGAAPAAQASPPGPGGATAAGPQPGEYRGCRRSTGEPA